MDRLADLRVVVAPGAAALERLAAAELRRYLALLGGAAPALLPSIPGSGPAVVVGAAAVEVAARASVEAPDDAQALLLRTVEADGRRLHLVVGGSPVATQWAAYRLLEELGCGFYLGGDALPPADPDRRMPEFALRERPAFAVRGALPWYNFLNGPTTWNLADHRRFCDQLAKGRANFVGFHAYDWEPWAAYPAEGAGRQAFAAGEPAATNAAVHRRDLWGVSPVPVEEYAFGTDRLFERGLFGADVALDWATHDEGIREAQALLREGLRYARARGIRTCVGFEVAGDPGDPANEARLQARLAHLAATYPIDYLWLWQAEHRGGGIRAIEDVGAGGAGPDLAERFAYLERPDRVAEGARVARYFALGHRLLREVAPAVRLVVSGWGGDHHQRFTDFYLGLHQILPPEVIFAALDNIDPTMAPTVSAVYGAIARERECWPILWFEGDAGGTRRDQWGPQPNVGPFAPLLDDAARKGCRGVLGIHWRTRAVEEVAAYTLARAWEPDLAPAAFFDRFAAASYGLVAGGEMAAVHRRLEELGPRWTGAAGQYECTAFEWFSTARRELLDPDGAPPSPFRARLLPDPGRLDELARLRDRVAALAAGATGARAERFAHLLAQMRWVATYDAAALQLYPDGPVEELLRRGEAALAAGGRAAARREGEEALRLVAESGLREAVQGLAEHVSSRSELGVLASVNGKALVAYKALLRRLEALLGRPVPELLAPGPWPAATRILIPSPPDLAEAGGACEVRAIVLAPDPPSVVEVSVAPLGAAASASAVLHHRRGAVYRGALPLDALADGPYEWWIRAEDGRGRASETARRSLNLLPAGALPLGAG